MLSFFVKRLGFQVHRFGQIDREPRLYAELFADPSLPVPRGFPYAIAGIG